MSTEKSIQKVALLVEIDGQAYYVNLPQDRLKMVVQLAQSLSDNGSLPVHKATNFKFIGHEETKTEG
jgi:hypothetical protein